MCRDCFCSWIVEGFEVGIGCKGFHGERVFLLYGSGGERRATGVWVGKGSQRASQLLPVILRGRLWFTAPTEHRFPRVDLESFGRGIFPRNIQRVGMFQK